MNGEQAPQNLQAERAVLGMILLDNSRYFEASNLTISDFSLPSHQEIYGAVVESMENRKAVDTILLMETLRGKNKLASIGGVVYLSTLTEGLSFGTKIEQLVEVLKEKSRARRLLMTLTNTLASIYEQHVPVKELIGQLQENLFPLMSDNKTVAVPGSQLFAEALKELRETAAISADRALGISWGVSAIDKLTGGLRPGEFYILGGATKDGKSSMSIQAMLSALASGHGVLAFSHEMTRLTVAYRMLAMTSEISHSHFRDSREMQMFEWPHVEESAKVLSEKNLWIYDAGTVDINTLRALTRFHVRQHKVSLVIVDFIQKIRAKGERKHEVVSNVSEGLRELAKSENIAVLALSQMSNPEEKKKRRPRLFDIKESGDVPADAHGVYAVYRPLNEQGRYDGHDEFGILAQRSGPGGAWVPVQFNESTLKFESRWT
jgi:replicative DNA helicase